MLGIGCPDRHALPHITLSKMRRPRRVLPSRASGFTLRLTGMVLAGRLSFSSGKASAAACGGRAAG